MKTMSLCMIVKDEEKYIEQCIESIHSLLTEVIIVDTGSVDRTLERAERFAPRVYHFNWNNNFADARNMALQYATGEYTIVLDADEEICPDDLPKLAQVIENTHADCISMQFVNYTEEKSTHIFNMHEGLRIFKTGAYHYEGAIHEQPVFNYPERKPVWEFSGVRVWHYGYLKKNAGVKKFNRNMSILNDILAQNPDEPFHLFNIGNQYLSIGDYKTALTYYEKAERYKDSKLAYSAHLIYRHATCLRKLGRNESSLLLMAEGMRTYPIFTDLEFLRGLTFTEMKRFSLALDSFNHCIELGQAPPSLCFFPDTHNVRPLIEIAGLYEKMEDYEKALQYYLKALEADNTRYSLIYKIAGVLNRIYMDKSVVLRRINSLYADCRYKSNVMVTVDALLDEKLFNEAGTTLQEFENSGETEDADTLFLKGRQLFYAGKYGEAYASFQSAVHPDVSKGVLPNVMPRAYDYMTACGLLRDDCRKSFLQYLASAPDNSETAVYQVFLCNNGQPLERKSLKMIPPVLSKLLSVCEYDVFEQTLSLLNQWEGDDALLCLAEVYNTNGFPDMAVKTVLRSIKELGALNASGVMILYKAYVG